VDHQPI